MGLESLYKEEESRAGFLFHVRTNQKNSHLILKRVFTPESNHADTLILDFPSFQTRRSTFLLFKSLSLGYFHVATWAKSPVSEKLERERWINHFYLWVTHIILCKCRYRSVLSVIMVSGGRGSPGQSSGLECQPSVDQLLCHSPQQWRKNKQYSQCVQIIEIHSSQGTWGLHG